jgi:hypothetical protein
MAGPGAAGLWPAMAKMRPVGGAVANSYHFAIFSFFHFFAFITCLFVIFMIFLVFSFLDCFIPNMTICYLLIATNLLKCRSIVGRIATNSTNRRNVLGFNIHQCTSVTKNQNTS